MTFELGTDIVKISRLNERVINRVLGDEELKIYESFGNEKRRMEFAAGRFAAKEALVKATRRKELEFRKIQFLVSEDGAPVPAQLTKEVVNADEILVSISHDGEYAVATVLVMWRD